MAGFFRSPFPTSDQDEYPDRLLAREGDIAKRPSWLEIEPVDDEDEPAALNIRQVTARPGDSISRMIGTSDPASVGAFSRANGLRRGDSTIYAGQTYVIPPGPEGVEDRGEGLLMIRRDNARLARLQAERERERAMRDARQLEAELALDESRYMPRYGYRSFDPPPPEFTARSSTKPDLATRLTDAANAALARLPAEWDNDPRARAIASILAREAGKNIGHLTGAYKMGEDIVKGGLFAARLVNPLGAGTYQGVAAWHDVFRGVGAAKDYGASRLQDLGLLRQDASDAWRGFREAHDPRATAPAATLGQEIQRQFNIAKNDGELEAEAASLFLGGPALKGIGTVGKAGELTGAAKWIAKGFTPAQAAYLAAPYEGLGHHFWQRSGMKIPIKGEDGKYLKIKLPQAISDSPWNVKKPRVSRGDFYELHYKVDPSFYSANLPRRVGGGQWVGSRLDYQKYDQLGRLWYGSPTRLKITAGGAAAAPGLLSYELTQGDQ